jgi:hypothetical protein
MGCYRNKVHFQFLHHDCVVTLMFKDSSIIYMVCLMSEQLQHILTVTPAWVFLFTAPLQFALCHTFCNCRETCLTVAVVLDLKWDKTISTCRPCCSSSWRPLSFLIRWWLTF